MKVEKVFIHHNFSQVNPDDPDTSSYDDLAVIELKKTIKVSSKIRPICIGTNPEQSDTVTVQGYGIVNCNEKKNSGKNIHSKNLMETDLIVLPDRECKQAYNKNKELFTKKHICVGPNQSGACKGIYLQLKKF